VLSEWERGKESLHERLERLLEVLEIRHVSSSSDTGVVSDGSQTLDVLESSERTVRGEGVGGHHDAVFVLEAEDGGSRHDGRSVRTRRGVRRHISNRSKRYYESLEKAKDAKRRGWEDVELEQ
jgi:hypothetical protein